MLIMIILKDHKICKLCQNCHVKCQSLFYRTDSSCSSVARSSSSSPNHTICLSADPVGPSVVISMIWFLECWIPYCKWWLFFCSFLWFMTEIVSGDNNCSFACFEGDLLEQEAFGLTNYLCLDINWVIVSYIVFCGFVGSFEFSQRTQTIWY